MKDSLDKDRQTARISKLARDYKNDGYQVFAELTGYDSPDVISGVRPDLVAKKGDETIIIEVKTRDTARSNKNKIEQLAHYADNNPGIRFDFVMTNPRPIPERFRRLRGAIANELVNAHSYYQVWKQLWPTEEVVHILNEYRVFFQCTRASLLQMFFMSIGKITQRGRNSTSIWRIFSEIEKYPNLTPQLSRSEIRILRKRLESHKNLLARIATYCNRKVIDIDFREEWPDKNAQQDIAITIKEAESLLGDLASIFNKISNAHDRNSWLFETPGIDDTTSLLKALSHLRENRNSNRPTNRSG